jgi:AbiV family abortive infection protein
LAVIFPEPMKEKMVEAIYFTLENAKGLYEEAKILQENNKCARAYSLYHLAFEECGRFYMIHNLLLQYASGEIKLKELNYGTLKKLGYERHDLKISKSFLGLFVTEILYLHDSTKVLDIEDFQKTNAEALAKLTEEYNKLKEQEIELNILKNVGLYVSFKDNEFHLPDDTITLSQFINIEKLAKIGLNSMEANIKYIEAKGGYSKMRENFEKERNNA